jgi:hypothetical protein
MASKRLVKVWSWRAADGRYWSLCLELSTVAGIVKTTAKNVRSCKPLISIDFYEPGRSLRVGH